MITIFIPAYNEEKNIRKSVENTIKAAKNAGDVKLDIVIVNDASKDTTAQEIEKLEKKYSCVRSIYHTKNQGIGYGVNEVIRIAKYPKFMIVPGDNDASPALLQNMFIHHKKADMVLSYYLNKELRGRFRNFISTLYGLIYMFTFQVYIQYFNGVGIYSTKKLRTIKLFSKRFSITAEMNTKLLCHGCTLYELSGFMQTGENGSKSIKLENFIEVIKTYIQLIREIKIERNPLYQKKPIRIMDC
jgi:glycosyltransferase involved in cell wall biosynthesis